MIFTCINDWLWHYIIKYLNILICNSNLAKHPQNNRSDVKKCTSGSLSGSNENLKIPCKRTKIFTAVNGSSFTVMESDWEVTDIPTGIMAAVQILLETCIWGLFTWQLIWAIISSGQCMLLNCEYCLVFCWQLLKSMQVL